MTSIPGQARSPRVLSGEPLKCPRCQSLLIPRLEQEVEVDICPDCQGVWLDRNEFAQLLGAVLWEVERYSARLAEAKSVAAAAQGNDAAAGAAAGLGGPNLSEVVSRFKNNFGGFLKRLKLTRKVST
jgi:Zn-finger nucleic acid-binding protein